MIDDHTVEIVFGIAAGLLVVLIPLTLINRKRKERRRKLILASSLILFLSLCWAWFVPVEVGRKGESSICKFRFQVFLSDTHDYNGDGDWSDWLFLYDYDNSSSKYGSIDFQKKIGGTSEYFGLKEIE